MMKLSITHNKIVENPANEVTSSRYFNKNKIKDENGEFLFDEDGIFSDRIFGRFDRCKCGAKTSPGLCRKCNTRVLNKKKIPDFYIKFNDFFIPNLVIDTSQDFCKNISKKIYDLINYKAFLYEGEIIDLDIDKLEVDKFDTSKILYGEDALVKIGATKTWYKKQVNDKIFIPHTSIRPIVTNRGKFVITKLNKLYLDLLDIKEHLDKIKPETVDIFELMIYRQYAIKKIHGIYNELYIMLCKNNKNIISSELRGQKITGSIRAVVINNYSVDEDVVIIGKYFIQTLYPYLYEKFRYNTGEIDIDGLNEYLLKENYLCLLNRQPTIGAKSIMGMIPQFSDKDEERFVIQINPIIFDGLAGDADGDVLCITSLYTKEAIKEAEKLLPSKNYIEGSNSSIRNKLPEDFEYVATQI